jgi:hypothetical protein
MNARSWMVGAGLAILSTGSAYAAGFSPSATGVAGQASHEIAEGGGCGATTLTQSTSQSILALNSVSCNAGGLHTNSSYFRAYDMTAYPGGFDICSINVGIEQAVGAGGTQPITVNVYSNTGGAFPAGTLTLIGSSPVAVLDQSLTVLAVPLAASVPASTTEIVIEVFTPDGQVAGNSFFMGSNNLGESGPSYIQAADCGIAAPATLTSIGFGNMQIVLDAIGDPVGGPTPVVEVPTLGAWGLMLLGVVLAGAAFVALRKRAVA